MSTHTEIELMKDEKYKFRELLRQHFPALGTDAPMGGADTSEALHRLYALLERNGNPVVIRDPKAPVLLTVASTDPGDEGLVYTRVAVTTTEEGAAMERARALAADVIRRHGALTDADNPLDAALLEELQMSVTFEDVRID